MRGLFIFRVRLDCATSCASLDGSLFLISTADRKQEARTLVIHSKRVHTHFTTYKSAVQYQNHYHITQQIHSCNVTLTFCMKYSCSLLYYRHYKLRTCRSIYCPLDRLNEHVSYAQEFDMIYHTDMLPTSVQTASCFCKTFDHQVLDVSS